MAQSRWPELASFAKFTARSTDERLALAAKLAKALGDCAPHPTLVGSAQLAAVTHDPTGVVLVAIPGGKFTMGLRDDELPDLKRGVFGADPKQRFDRELDTWCAASRLAHPVAVTPFLCAASVVYPDGRAKPSDDDDEDPWYEGAAASKLVTTLAKLKLRLLSEAEWEYVAREGGERSWIVDAAGKSGFDLDRGDAPDNAWGIGRLKSTHGEFVADSWHPTYKSAPADSRAWNAKAMPGVHRGSNGSWEDEACAFGCHASWRAQGNSGCARPARDLP